MQNLVFLVMNKNTTFMHKFYKLQEKEKKIKLRVS